MNEKLNLKALQNGSDIRGIAMDGVDGEKPNLTDREARLLTRGFILWLCQKSGKEPTGMRLSIGHDSRLSAEMLKNAAIDEAVCDGAEILDCGLASTPAMFMSTVFEDYACDGAIMITASHLPWNRNGFKYFDRDGGLDKQDIAKIIELAEDEEASRRAVRDKSGGAVGSSRPAELLDRYAEHLRGLITKGICGAEAVGTACGGSSTNGSGGNGEVSAAADCERPQAAARPLAGLKIAVDAGNGAGGFYAEKVLAPLGADVSASQFLEPDGRFPNHAPNPEDKAAMQSVSDAVVRSGADLGIIFDTDVDRSAAVDSSGREIARNGIVAMAAALIADDHPGTTVVTDSITSPQLTAFLEEKLGLKHLRYKRGYKNVINKSKELNQSGTHSALAIETSGHAAFKENYFLDDGAYLAAKIVIQAALLHKKGKGIDSLIAGLQEPAEAREVRFPILCDDFALYADEVLAKFQAFAENAGTSGFAPAGVSVVSPNYEGVRLEFDKSCGSGWCLLRKSLHDPIMPLNLESDEVGGTAKMTEILRRFFADCGKLDTKAL